MKVITLREGKERSLLRQHPRVFQGSVAKGGADQGETVRVQGKSRDDLQAVMALYRNDESIDMPLAFKNFKD